MLRAITHHLQVIGAARIMVSSTLLLIRKTSCFLFMLALHNVTPGTHPNAT